MVQPSLRIYLSANLAIYLFVAFSFFPEGLGLGIAALVFSIFFSAPTLVVLIACFALLQRFKMELAGSWMVLLLSVTIAAFVPQLLLSLWESGKIILNNDLLLLSTGSAFAGTLFQCFYLHRYFKTLSHESYPTTEIN